MIRLLQYVLAFGVGALTAYMATGVVLLTPEYKSATDLTTIQCFNRGYTEQDIATCRQAVQITHKKVMGGYY